MEPVATLTVGAIAQMAFTEFIKSGSGAAAKNTFEGTVALVKKLQSRIIEKFKDNPRAEKAVAEIKKDGNSNSLKKLTKYLDIEMAEDEAFSNNIQQIAQQIKNYHNQTSVAQANNNFGRDQNIINQPQGEIRIGGS